MRFIIQRGAIRSSPEKSIHFNWYLKIGEYYQDIWKTYLKDCFISRKVSEDFIRGNRIQKEEFRTPGDITLFLIVINYLEGKPSGRLVCRFVLDEAEQEKIFLFRGIEMFKGKAKIFLISGRRFINEIKINKLGSKSKLLLGAKYERTKKN